jgi:type I restriction enzyme S subunit
LTSEQQKLEDIKGKNSLDREWHDEKLGEVAHINLGQSPKGEYYNEEGDGPHFIQGSKNFGNKYPELERFCSQPKREAEEGDVLISVRAPVGPVNIAPEDLCIGRGVTALKMDDGSNEYLYYYLKYFENKWSQYADGTAFNSITKSDLQNLEIPYPPVEEQKKISGLLYQIDSKIETNNRINDILEEMSRALFRSRLVEFEPYEEFKSSELGDIPEEFEVTELSELLSLEYGEGLSKDDRTGDKHPVYGSNGINGSHSDYLIEGPGIIVGRKGTIGTVNYEPRDFWCIDTTFYLEPKREYDMLFYYHLLKNGVRLKHLGSDSAVPGLNRNTVHDQKVAIPGEERIAEFSQLVKPMYEIKEKNRRENKYLEELRDTLLPKLMSGEIRVNDIELDELEVDSEV